MQFAEGETVLCYHGPILYQAKCIKTEIKNKVPQYFIHYNGWNKGWDEWVSYPRVLKLNEENLKKQNELFEIHG
jgi:mortality factor 4-like protein 1